MVVTGEAITNLSDVVAVLPVEVADKVMNLVLILKALGMFAIFYIIYAVVMGILNYRKMQKLICIENKVDDIDKKVNRILRKKKKS